MPNHGKYPDELRERAVRMVLDHGHEYGSQWEAICSVAEKLGPKPETVRLWVRQAERDTKALKVGDTARSIHYGPCIVLKVNAKSYRIRLPSGFETTQDKAWVS